MNVNIIKPKELPKYFLFLLFITVQSVYSQTARQGGGGQPIGTISGKVTDAMSNMPMEYTTVALLSLKDSSLVTGGITNSRGVFKLENIPAGRYLIRVNFIGYHAHIIDSVHIRRQTPNLNYSSISLSPAVENLSEVEIVAERALFQNAIDRKVFNVDKSITTSGGTALEVLEKIPSVNVDMDGSVSLRGSENVRILIDGKPSVLGGEMLEQLPASSIESVEIITNPSAKYDPEGISGIINIVTKHSKIQGFNGSVNANFSRIDRFNGGFNLNYRQGIVNYYINYNYRKNYSTFTRTNLRENFYSTDAMWFLQDGNSVRNNESHTIKTGLDFSFTNNSSLSFSAMFNTNNRNSDELIEFQRRDMDYALNQLYTRGNLSDRDRNSYDLSINYRKRYNKDQTLSADISLSQSDGLSSQNIEQIFYNTDYSPSVVDPLNERTLSDSYNRILSARLDYSRTILKDIKFETGFKADIRVMGDDYHAERLSDMMWFNDTNRSNNFIYSDEILAAYGILSGKYNKLGWQGGLRAEQAFTHPELKTTSEKFDKSYFSLFPSAHLSYELTSSKVFMLNYSRRINRPSTWSLNPFPNYTDPLNVRKGNPFLDPEYINSFEFSYGMYRNDISLTSSVYYRYTTDVISRFRQSLNDSLLVITEANLARSENYGVEFIAMLQILKWWNINYSLNFYESRIDGSNLDANATNQGFSWNTKLNSNMNLPYQMDLQLSGMYFAPMVVAQGKMKARYWGDVGFRKHIWNRKGSIGFRVSDVLNSRQFRIAFEEATYRQDFTRKRDTTNFFLTFTYRFGTSTRQQDQQRQRRQDDNGTQQDVEMMY